ncbi:MAG: hypothetical protein OHK0029_19280 [Armatimonadaceae bacterium]
MLSRLLLVFVSLNLILLPAKVSAQTWDLFDATTIETNDYHNGNGVWSAEGSSSLSWVFPDGYTNDIHAKASGLTEDGTYVANGYRKVRFTATWTTTLPPMSISIGDKKTWTITEDGGYASASHNGVSASSSSGDTGWVSGSVNVISGKAELTRSAGAHAFGEIIAYSLGEAIMSIDFTP